MSTLKKESLLDTIELDRDSEFLRSTALVERFNELDDVDAAVNY